MIKKLYANLNVGLLEVRCERSEIGVSWRSSNEALVTSFTTQIGKLEHVFLRPETASTIDDELDTLITEQWHCLHRR